MFRTLSCLWGLLVLGIVLVGWSPQKPVRVIIPAEVEVQGARFTLGEIAQLSEGNESIRQQLDTIELGASPLPGQERLFTRQQLLIRLRQQKIEPDSIHIEMPGTIRIIRQAQVIQGDKLLAFARDRLKLAIGDSADLWTPESAPVLPALAGGEVEFVPDGEPRAGSSYAQVGIQVRQGGGTVARVVYTFRAPPRSRALVVRSGESVTVLVHVDEITLETNGNARSSGAQGETISVYLPETKRTVRAKVIEKGMVQMSP